MSACLLPAASTFASPPRPPLQEGPPDPVAAFSDRLDVVRLSLDVGVVDGMGRPVEGLGRDDFEVRLRGKRAKVEAVDWIAESPATADLGGLDAPTGVAVAATRPAPAPLRRRVYFMQAPWWGSHQVGHLRMRDDLQEMVGELPSDTVAAVVAFDSHLKLHQDFTRDTELLRAALDKGRGFHPASWPAAIPADGPSLARHLDPAAARAVAFPAEGLEMVARALEADGGSGSIVWVGWGLSRVLRYDYTRMIRALLRSEAPVFILDIADADVHSQEYGLRQLAHDTGGQYFNTRQHPGREVKRVSNLLQRGRYRLTVVCPPLAAGGHPLQVRLRGYAGYRRVLAPKHAWIRSAPPPPPAAGRRAP